MSTYDSLPHWWKCAMCRNSHPEVFLGKGVLKICSKFTVEHPYRSAISIKLQSNVIEITLRYGCFPVNLLHIFRAPFPKNTSGRLLLIKGNTDSPNKPRNEVVNRGTWCNEYALVTAWFRIQYDQYFSNLLYFPGLFYEPTG